MIREISAYVLLAAIIIGSLINIRFMDKTFSSLEDMADEAYTCAVNGDSEQAENLLSSACSEWLALDGYTHIFLKHTEIDSTTDAFFEMLSDISEGNTDAASGSLRKLKAHLESLISAEQISFGSVF